MLEWLFKYPYDTFARGRLVYMSRLPGELRFLLFAAFAALAWFFYREVSAKLPPRRRWALVGMRFVTYAVVFFILGMPALAMKASRSKTFFTIVMVDTSRSMSIEDAGVPPGAGKVSRIEAAAEVLLGGPGGLLRGLRSRSNVLLYEFDAGARRRGRAGAFLAEGDYTNIFRSVRDVEADLRALPVAGVVMFTDGCRNTGGPPEDAARLLAARGIPLHIVGLGDPAAVRDYEVVSVFAPKRVRRNAEVELQITLRHTGLDGPFTLRVTRAESEIISREIVPDEGTDLKLVRLTFTPDHEGSATYSAAIPAAAGEDVTENNSRDFVIEMEDDRLPVLYIEGSPRMEYRFLRRAMFRDPDFRVVGMLRLAKDRFYVQGASSREKYLEAGFPETRERLFAFQAVILGDVEAALFTPEQQELLREFVQVRGGGLLMLGGVNSFGLGKYAGTPVGKALPVAVSHSDPPYSDERYDPEVAPGCYRHPVMRLHADADENRRMWENAPPLIGITPVGGVKSGATVLLVKKGTAAPVLAAQTYGQGRTAAFMSGGSWYWQVSRPAEDEFHERFWKQLTRWLVMGAKQQLTARTERDIYGRRDPVIVRATVLGKDLRPVNDATVIATVTDPMANAEEIPMRWILSEEGVYQCRYVPAEAGDHGVSVKVEGWDKVKPAATGFLVTEPLIEFSDSNLKEELLESMARITGGRYYHLGDPAALTQDILREIEKSIEKATTGGASPDMKAVWDMPVLYVLLLGLMGGEWLLRRRSGLA